MTESVRPSAALRIVRPYATEEALLESELETIGRTGVLLVGAEAKAAGTVLRFDVVLADGAVLLRGEGRVLGFKERGFRGETALAVRFTRLDARSKAFVDRAVARREEKGRALPSSNAEPPEGDRPSATSIAPTSIVPAPPSSASATSTSIVPAPPSSASATSASAAPASTPAPLAPPSSPSTHDDDPGARLARLRQRAAALSPERIEALLRSSPRRHGG